MSNSQYEPYIESVEVNDNPSTVLAVERSAVFRIFREYLKFPNKAYENSVKDGSLKEQLESSINAVNELIPVVLAQKETSHNTTLRAACKKPGLNKLKMNGLKSNTDTQPPDFSSLHQATLENKSLEREYTRLFDVGYDGKAPCSLYGGEYTEARMHEMEELVRFYNFFGLKPGNARREQELPDHITIELEFLHYLTYREAKTLNASIDASAFNRAQRDFIGRHVGAWIDEVTTNMKEACGSDFFLNLLSLLSYYLEREMVYLTQLVGPADKTKVSPQSYSAGRII